MVLAGLAVTLIMSALFRTAFQNGGGRGREMARANLNAYALGIVRELAPLDGATLQAALESLYETRQLLVRVRERDGREVTPGGNDFYQGEPIPRFEEFRPRRMWMRGDLEIGFSRGRGMVSVQQGNRIYLFAIPGMGPSELRAELVTLAVVLLLGVIALVYWRVRKMIAPLRALKAGVDALAQGELSTRVNVAHRKPDEFSALANDFNRMAQELQGMLLAREELLFAVSHELRTPLTRARLALEFVPEGKARASLKGDLSEMSTLVDDLMEFGRLRGNPTLNRTQTRLSALVLAAVADANALPGQDPRRVEVVFGSGFAHPDGKETSKDQGNSHLEPEAEVDAARLRGVLRNLVENALAYGSVEPGASAVRVESLLETSTLSPGTRTWIVRVKDDGSGIPEGEAERVFLPFTRLEESRSRAHGGLGLGLPLARRAIEAHGGTLKLLRFAPQGAVFEWRIPLDSKKA
jgi:signal transduction histidine kinase